MFKNIKKLKKIVENYDKIMVLIENNAPKTKKKSFSVKNTPKNQLQIIEKMKGE